MSSVEEEKALGVEDGGTRSEARGVPLPYELVEVGELFFTLGMRPAEEG